MSGNLDLKKICIQNFRKDCRPRSRRGASLRIAPLANEGVLLNFVIFCGVGVLGLSARLWAPRFDPGVGLMVRSYSVLSGVIESVSSFLGLFWVFRVSVLGKCKHNRHGRGVTDRVKEGSRISFVALDPWKYVFPIYLGSVFPFLLYS